ncbi:MAG: EamA family transporter [Vampirovibrionales bacterium]
MSHALSASGLSPNSRVNYWPYVAMVAVYLSWSTTFAAMRVGIETLPPAVLTALRYGWTVLLFAPFVDGRVWRLPPRVWGMNALVGLLIFGLGNSLTPFNLQIIPTGVAAAVVALNPFWLLALSWVLPPKERVTPGVLGALVLGLGGLLLVLSPDMPYWFKGGHSAVLTAVLWQIVASFGWSLGSMLARWLHQAEPQAAHLGFRFQLGLVVQQNLVAALALTGVAVWQGHHPWAFMTQGFSLQVLHQPHVWAVAYLVVMGTGIGMVCYLYALQTLPLALTGTFAYVTPVLTAVLGVCYCVSPFTGSWLWKCRRYFAGSPDSSLNSSTLQISLLRCNAALAHHDAFGVLFAAHYAGR